MSKIGVLGAGTWGIALARMLVNNGHDICVWSALTEEIDQLVKNNEHNNLPGVKIPDTINYSKNIGDACVNSDVYYICCCFKISEKYC